MFLRSMLSKESIDFLEEHFMDDFADWEVDNISGPLDELALSLDNFSSVSLSAAIKLFIAKHRLRMDNFTAENNTEILPPIFPLEYRLAATVLHSLIFLLGFFGNILIVVVVHRTKSLHVPTYSYLVSLALADLLVIIAAMPEAIVSYQLYARQWIFGQVGCSSMIFLSFLGINTSSMSILAFTVERFIAICMPIKAKSMCTLSRAKRINASLWLVSLVCSCPWLGLTISRPDSRFPNMQVCSFRFPPDKYAYIFGSDILIFYVIPLLTASVLYFKIALALRTSSRTTTLRDSSASMSLKRGSSNCNSFKEHSSKNHDNQTELITSESLRLTTLPELHRSRIKVVRMLFVIVVTFAVLWLPYRAISLYNAFATKPIYNLWVMFFAKTCIFLNSSVNPILYNAMSLRFRQASKNILCGSSTSNKPKATYSVHSKLVSTPHPSPGLPVAHHSANYSGTDSESVSLAAPRTLLAQLDTL